MEPLNVTRGMVDEKRRAAEAALAPFAAYRTGPTDALFERIRPRDEDYAIAFKPQYVDLARTGYAPFFASKQIPTPGDPARTGIRMAVTPALALLAGNLPVYRFFPGGFKGVAAMLEPRVWWGTWKWVRPGTDDGISFNGLVEVEEGRWVWFPKPWRVLTVVN